MPVYEYYCENDKKVFEALGSIAKSDAPAKCPKCGGSAYRIMPTTFASLSRVKGLKERVPFHHHPVRNETVKRGIAPVKPQAKAPRTSSSKAIAKAKAKKN
jgi:putative FmdB family regulatory protein